MVNLAELDTAFLVPCKHCAELLQEQERICPFCGTDQSITDDAGDAEPELEPPERGASAEAEAPAPIPVESALMPAPAAQGLMDHPLPTSAANEEGKSGIGGVGPDVFWQKEVPAGGGPAHWARSSVARNRLLIGIVAALVALLLLAVVHDHFFADRQSEAGKPRELGANVEQVQEQAAKPEQPGDAAAALKASEALGLGEPAAAPAAAASAPEAPIVAKPAPGTGAAAPKEKDCSETLAALALCSNR